MTQRCAFDSARLSQIIQAFSKKIDNLTYYDVINLVEVTSYCIQDAYFAISPASGNIITSNPGNPGAQQRLFTEAKGRILQVNKDYAIGDSIRSDANRDILIEIEKEDVIADLKRAYYELLNDRRNSLIDWFEWVRSCKIDGRTALQEHVESNVGRVGKDVVGTFFTPSHTSFFEKYMNISRADLERFNLEANDFAASVANRTSLTGRDMLKLEIYVVSMLIRGKYHNLANARHAQAMKNSIYMLPHPIRQSLPNDDSLTASTGNAVFDFKNVIMYISQIISADAFAEKNVHQRAIRWMESIERARRHYNAGPRQSLSHDDGEAALKSAIDFLTDGKVISPSDLKKSQHDTLFNRTTSVGVGALTGYAATFLGSIDPFSTMGLTAITGTAAASTATTEFIVKWPLAQKALNLSDDQRRLQNIMTAKAAILRGNWLDAHAAMASPE